MQHGHKVKKLSLEVKCEITYNVSQRMSIMDFWNGWSCLTSRTSESTKL